MSDFDIKYWHRAAVREAGYAVATAHFWSAFCPIKIHSENESENVSMRFRAHYEIDKLLSEKTMRGPVIEVIQVCMAARQAEIAIFGNVFEEIKNDSKTVESAIATADTQNRDTAAARHEIDADYPLTASMVEVAKPAIKRIAKAAVDRAWELHEKGKLVDGAILLHAKEVKSLLLGSSGKRPHPESSPLARFIISMLMGLMTASYLVCLLWPIRLLWIWGDAYQDGLHATPQTLFRRVLLLLMMTVGGFGVLMNWFAVDWLLRRGRWRLGSAILLLSFVAIGLGWHVNRVYPFNSDRYLDGFRDRMKPLVNAAALRTWLAAVKDKSGMDQEIDEKNWPPEIKAMSPFYVYLTAPPGSPPDSPKILILRWGGTWGSSSLAIGLKEIKSEPIPPDFIVRTLEPGVFVGFGQD